MHLPRIMIAGMASGSGKTTVTCGILQAIKNRGVVAAASKCGPDYIDPMFHGTVLGIQANNLDAYFCGEEEVRLLLGHNAGGAGMAVIEGVMGYYDGLALATYEGSSHDIARITKTPVILVVQCRGMGLSIVPLIKGMMDYQKESYIKGVILNGITGMLYNRLKEVIESELVIKVCGYLPKLDAVNIESRHLGLITPKEIACIKEQVEVLGKQVEACCDMDTIMEIAGEAQELELPVGEYPILDHTKHTHTSSKHKLRIGIAYDQAFCFYYKDNLELLEALGCELVWFSPLKDEELPVNLQGILLGGGYPELYGNELSGNKSMKGSIRKALSDGVFCLAECGGFMYLQETMEDADGTTYDMVGYFKGRSFKTGKLVRFGYIQLEALADNFLQKKGEIMRGHEFHYWDSSNAGRAYHAVKPTGSKQWDCCHVTANVFAGYPHIHYYSNPAFINKFVACCKGRMKR